MRGKMLFASLTCLIVCLSGLFGEISAFGADQSQEVVGQDWYSGEGMDEFSLDLPSSVYPEYTDYEDYSDEYIYTGDIYYEEAEGLA